MTTNFTLRDFFSFLLTGCIFVVAMLILYHEEFFNYLGWNSNLNEFSWGWLILLVPSIYLIGHVFGTLSFLLLRVHNSIKKRLKGKNYSSKFFILLLQCVCLYRQRVNYAIIKYKMPEYFKDQEEFWTTCAILQIKNYYAPAEYWCYLNDFFSSITLICIISSFIAFLQCKCEFGIIFLIFAILAYFRAQLYAKYFVLTVNRLMKAKDMVNNSD